MFGRVKDRIKAYDEPRDPLTKVGLYGLLTLIAAVVAVGGWLGAKSAGKEAGLQASEAVQSIAADQLARGCGRNQIQRGYLKLRGTEVDSPTARNASELFQVVWCEATYRPGYRGPTIYLPHDAERCFLDLLRDGYWNHREAVTDPARLRELC